MSSGRANKPDTPADLRLRECLTATEKRCFNMVAGAGSGKTTSLVKALSTLVAERGASLKLHRQRIACITYTEVAAEEIWSDVGNNSIVHVSTIHSFLWMVARTFQKDIRDWVLSRVNERIEELKSTASDFGPRVQQRTRDKNRRDVERFEAIKPQIEAVRGFTYGTGSDYANGILGHDDIIRMATDFIRERRLFQTILVQQFPYVFVDESQDTQEAVVTALKQVAARAGGRFCLGFFGDPMQKIYATGIGVVSLEEDWLHIPKEENFRCSTTVLNVANAIRKSGDDLVQVGGRTQEVVGARLPVLGTARIFILSADNQRDGNVAAIRNWVADRNVDEAWRIGPNADVKMLVIVHRMAANRLGFGNLYAAMNDKAPQAFRDGFLDATAWPLRPFQSFVLPMVEAIEADDEFAAMTLLREYSPLLERDRFPKEGVAKLLASLRAASYRLRDLMAPGSGATVHDVLSLLCDSQLTSLDPLLRSYLADGITDAKPENQRAAQKEEAREEEDDDGGKEIAAMTLYLACLASEFRGYREYIQEKSPFSTQQGIKGTEFGRILVILDDEESTHVQFSYDKYFGVVPPSKRDLQNIAEGKETTIDRTRRLFYVCCTRAQIDLVVVYFSQDPAEAERCVRASKIFQDTDILTAASLAQIG